MGSVIRLIDLSSAQPAQNVDRDLLVANGYAGAYIRCGEGLHDSSRDSFLAHANNLVRPDMAIRIGAYHVIAPSSGNPEGQAENLVKWSAIGTMLMPYAIDAERNRPLGQDAKDWVKFLGAYRGRLQQLNVRHILYTYTSFQQEMVLAGIPKVDWFLARYPQLHYPGADAEFLRQSVLQHARQYAAAVAKGDAPTAATEARAKARDAAALARLGRMPEPLGTAPAGAVLWQWGGDANASTVPGVHDVLCDQSEFLGNSDTWANFWA